MEIILTFLEGLASFISPCLLPLIPIYLSYIIGDSVEEKGTKFLRSVFFVLGFSVVFISLGVFSATLGSFVYIYENYINFIFGVFIILIGLNYLGVINIKILNMTKKFNFKAKKASLSTAFVFGVFFAAGFTPCIGAFLGSALMMASTAGSVLQGTAYLISYSLGLGIPFILSAVFFDKVEFIHKLIKKHYTKVNLVSGLMLISIGVYQIYNSLGGLF